MNFELLEKFEWYNEPENVRFDKDGMAIYSRVNTDFWQSIHRGFKKDDGHFFFCRQNGNFSLTFKWGVEDISQFSQCGLMVRIDERNWFKASMMSEAVDNSLFVSSLTIGGHSDWSGVEMDESVKELWFRLNRIDDDYVFSYSKDGINFVKERMFYLKSYEDVKVGAYIASPNQNDFCAKLSEMKLEQ